MEENTEIKEYANAELARLSYDEFCDKFNPQVPSHGNDFLDHLEMGLLYLNGDKTGHTYRHNETNENTFRINTFDGAWLLNAKKVGTDGKDVIFFKPFTDLQATLSMFKTFNVKIFKWGSGEDGMTSLQKWRLMDGKETRHIKFRRDILEHRMAFLSKDEKWYTLGEYRYSKAIVKDRSLVNVPIPLCYNPNFIYKDADVKTYMNSDDYIQELDNFNMFVNIRLTAYYEWFVYIREDDKSLGIKIPIAPESSKDVFALRNIKEGDSRKRAICNFVREHYRTIKTDYNEEERQVLVKQHLRGESKFNWRGLQVNIIPSEYDLNRIKTRKKFVQV